MGQVTGPRPKDDPLLSIYKVADIRPLIDRQFWECAPLILAPSASKIFYIQPLRDFWWGLQKEGGFSLSLGVIGYSLPSYDTYARQALFHVFSNYAGFEPDLEVEGRRKTKIRILVYMQDADSEASLRARYRFADWSRTEMCVKGFNEKTVDWLLR